MSSEEARKLARWIVKTSDAIVKFGRTNGVNVLHLRKSEGSQTISSPTEWAYHGWNRTNRKKEVASDRDKEAALTA